MIILTDESPMPFGKHRGKAMANVPAKYLLWLWDQNQGQKPFGEDSKSVQLYISQNLDALKLEVKDD